jgi:hypothetical protein
MLKLHSSSEFTLHRTENTIMSKDDLREAPLPTTTAMIIQLYSIYSEIGHEEQNITKCLSNKQYYK